MPVGFAPQVVYRCSAACSWTRSSYKGSSLQVEMRKLSELACMSVQGMLSALPTMVFLSLSRGKD